MSPIADHNGRAACDMSCVLPLKHGGRDSNLTKGTDVRMFLSRVCADLCEGRGLGKGLISRPRSPTNRAPEGANDGLQSH
jgi:hypothetical protein